MIERIKQHQVEDEYNAPRDIDKETNKAQVHPERNSSQAIVPSPLNLNRASHSDEENSHKKSIRGLSPSVVPSPLDLNQNRAIKNS